MKSLTKLLIDLGYLSAEPSSPLLGPDENPLFVYAAAGLFSEAEVLAGIAQHLAIPLLLGEETESALHESFNQPRIRELCLLHRALPIALPSGELALALSDPLNIEGQRALEFALSQPVIKALTSETIIRRVMEKHHTAKEPLDLDAAMRGSSTTPDSRTSPDDLVDEGAADAPPIVRLSHQLISQAIEAGASDLHLEPTADGLRVRMRLDGVMQPLIDIPARLKLALTSRFKLLSGMDIAERRRPQDGRLRIKSQGKTIDTRVSSVATPHGEKLVFRILHSTMGQVSLASLGLPSRIEGQLHRLLKAEGKMILVTGPTGSGKTTTLYAALGELNNGHKNIQTVEDPIEYRIAGINQIQVHEQIDLTFAAALRSVLRQDPDVIMVGEIRDQETAQVALQAAQTGHLVLSTLHANDALSAFLRLRHLGVEASTMAGAISAVIAQRLVRRLCSACAKPASASYRAKYQATIQAAHLDQAPLLEPVGCQACHNIGFRSRATVLSLLEVTPHLAELIHREVPVQELEAMALAEGYAPLSHHARELVASGATSIDEIESFFTQAPAALPITRTPASAGIAKPRVLLVEDDDDVRHVLRCVLERALFQVVEAPNGQAALENLYASAPETLPNLILCDLMMPVMDGREFLKHLQSRDQLRAVPVIILTAVDTEENETGLIDLGAVDFVSKASSAEVMLSRVRRSLRS